MALRRPGCRRPPGLRQPSPDRGPRRPTTRRLSPGGTPVTASTFPAEAEAAPAPYVDEEDLAGGLSRLRRRAGMLPTERWLAIAGGVLMPLGVILVLIGWYGAAHTTRLFEEIPYLISGGMLGICLSGIGAALYFGYWLTRLVSGQRETVELLARMEAKLDGAATADSN